MSYAKRMIEVEDAAYEALRETMRDCERCGDKVDPPDVDQRLCDYCAQIMYKDD